MQRVCEAAAGGPPAPYPFLNSWVDLGVYGSGSPVDSGFRFDVYGFVPFSFGTFGSEALVAEPAKDLGVAKLVRAALAVGNYVVHFGAAGLL